MAEAKSAALSAAAVPSLFVETVERVRPDLRLLGWMADRWGVPAALWVSAVLRVTGLVAAQFLPAPRDREIVTT